MAQASEGYASSGRNTTKSAVKSTATTTAKASSTTSKVSKVSNTSVAKAVAKTTTATKTPTVKVVYPPVVTPSAGSTTGVTWTSLADLVNGGTVITPTTTTPTKTPTVEVVYPPVVTPSAGSTTGVTWTSLADLVNGGTVITPTTTTPTAVTAAPVTKTQSGRTSIATTPTTKIVTTPAGNEMVTSAPNPASLTSYEEIAKNLIGTSDFTLDLINRLATHEVEDWDSQLLNGYYFSTVADNVPDSWQSREADQINDWIASGYDESMLPTSLSPMAAQAYGISEDDRQALGYATVENYTKPNDTDYEWLRTAVGDGSGGYATSEEETDEDEESIVEPTTSSPGEATWSDQYHVPGAPDWWRGLVPSYSSPELEYAALLNSMIPFLSSEDQQSVATNLAILYPDVFGSYSASIASFQLPSTLTTESTTARRVNTETGAIPYLGSAFGTDMTRSMYSPERAQEILNTLTKVKDKINADMGPGYYYLQQFAGSLQQIGTTPTRAKMTQFLSAIDTLIGASESESLSAYGPLVKMISTPFFSAGSVLPVSKNSETGKYTFGEANKTLY